MIDFFLQYGYYSLFYFTGFPITIFLTFFMMNIFYYDGGRVYKTYLKDLTNDQKMIVISSVIGFLWPLFLLIDILLMFFLLVVLLPTQFTFYLLNKINKGK